MRKPQFSKSSERIPVLPFVLKTTNSSSNSWNHFYLLVVLLHDYMFSYMNLYWKLVALEVMIYCKYLDKVWMWFPGTHWILDHGLGRRRVGGYVTRGTIRITPITSGSRIRSVAANVPVGWVVIPWRLVSVAAVGWISVSWVHRDDTEKHKPPGSWREFWLLQFNIEQHKCPWKDLLIKKQYRHPTLKPLHVLNLLLVCLISRRWSHIS